MEPGWVRPRGPGRPLNGAWEHREELVRYVRRLLGAQAEVAEDVVQEAYLRLHQRAAEGSPVRDARPWLFRVARNLALDERRRSRRGDAALSSLGVMTAPPRGPLEVLQGREEAREALRGIESLPPNERRTMILDQAGLAPAAIARRVGTTTNAVHQSLFRARRRLRDARAAAWGLLPVPLVRLVLRAAGSPALEGLPALAPGSGGRMAGGAGLVGLVAATLIGGAVVAEQRIVPHHPPARAEARASTPSPSAGDPAPAATAAATGTVLAERSPSPRSTARVAPAATHAARRARRDDAGEPGTGGAVPGDDLADVSVARGREAPEARDDGREDEFPRPTGSSPGSTETRNDHSEGGDSPAATVASAPAEPAAEPEDGHHAPAPEHTVAAPSPPTTTTEPSSEPAERE